MKYHNETPTTEWTSNVVTESGVFDGNYDE